MNSDGRDSATRHCVLQGLHCVDEPKTAQPSPDTMIVDQATPIVHDNLGAPIPIGPRELDIIETYLSSLLAEVIGKADPQL